MAELNKRELLKTILYEVKAIRAKVDATSDDLLHFRKEMLEFKQEMYDFRNEMYDFRKETANNFNKVNRRLSFVETDFEQLNTRVDKLELGSST